MLVFASCKDAKTRNWETTAIENSDNTAEGQLYACPMHPEVTGKQGEECSKCGMELTDQLLKRKLFWRNGKQKSCCNSIFYYLDANVIIWN
jgi:methionyl-tRNA synthetase